MKSKKLLLSPEYMKDAKKLLFLPGQSHILLACIAAVMLYGIAVCYGWTVCGADREGFMNDSCVHQNFFFFFEMTGLFTKNGNCVV